MCKFKDLNEVLGLRCHWVYILLVALNSIASDLIDWNYFSSKSSELCCSSDSIKVPPTTIPLCTSFIDISVNIKHCRGTSFLHVCKILSALPFNFLFNGINNNINMSFYLGFQIDPGGFFDSNVISNLNKLSHDWIFSCINNNLPVAIANTLIFK